MAAYIVATVRVSDPVRFGAYVKAVAGIAEQHGGEYLLRGRIADVVEGVVDDKEFVVVTRFPSADAARGYVNSPGYQAGKQLRIGAASIEARLLVDPA